MSLRIIVTPKGEETFNLISTQLLERWGEEYVIRFQAKVEKSIQGILISPNIYPVAEEHTGLRKCVLHKTCSMFYKVDNDVILIAYFWDNRQDPIFT